MVYVGIGSNIERERNIPSGLEALRERFGDLAVSSIYESKALGFEGANFYNLVVGFATSEDVLAVARALQEIEARHGRVHHSLRYASRTLDLDLLLYDDLITREHGLVLPRPEILKHAFVLLPLAEIAGHLRHPLTGQTYEDLWQSFDKTGQALWPV